MHTAQELGATPKPAASFGKTAWEKSSSDISVTAQADAEADVRHGEDPIANSLIRDLLFTYPVSSSHLWEPKSHYGARMRQFLSFG